MQYKIKYVILALCMAAQINNLHASAAANPNAIARATAPALLSLDQINFHIQNIRGQLALVDPAFNERMAKEHQYLAQLHREAGRVFVPSKPVQLIYQGVEIRQALKHYEQLKAMIEA